MHEDSLSTLQVLSRAHQGLLRIRKCGAEDTAALIAEPRVGAGATYVCNLKARRWDRVFDVYIPGANLCP